MYYEKDTVRLSFADLIKTVTKDKNPDKEFPYTLEVCRCRYCAYNHKGKCSLRQCCCLEERVRAKSCTIEEVMNQAFSFVKENLFHYRLREAVLHINEKKSCFIDRTHRKRFYESCALTRRKDAKFIAQLFLLSATEGLWLKTKEIMLRKKIIYDCMDLSGIYPKEYLYYAAAADIEYGGCHLDVEDLFNDEVVDDEAFRLLTVAAAICAYGLNVVKIAEKKKRNKWKGDKNSDRRKDERNE